MSTNLVINQTKCSKQEYSNNDKIFEYSFSPSNVSSDIQSYQTIGIYQHPVLQLTNEKISDSSVLRNSSISSTESKKELDTRLFPGSPLMSNGQSILKNVDLSSRLLYGEDTRSSKSANALSSYSADNFIPLVPSIAANVQNVDHIIPTYWVRGGMSSRSVIRNIDYLKMCNLKK